MPISVSRPNDRLWPRRKCACVFSACAAPETQRRRHAIWTSAFFMGFPRSAPALVQSVELFSSVGDGQKRNKFTNLRGGRWGSALLRGPITVELQHPSGLRGYGAPLRCSGRNHIARSDRCVLRVEVAARG